jgi:hypothetical protein
MWNSSTLWKENGWNTASFRMVSLKAKRDTKERLKMIILTMTGFHPHSCCVFETAKNLCWPAWSFVADQNFFEKYN